MSYCLSILVNIEIAFKKDIISEIKAVNYDKSVDRVELMKLIRMTKGICKLIRSLFYTIFSGILNSFKQSNPQVLI